jgi:hypothetical protein
MYIEMNAVLNDMGLTTKDASNKLEALFKKIEKQPYGQKTKITTREPGYIIQADLLFMPNDEGFKYLLVVVDTNNNALDAEPLKSKTSKTIIDGLNRIFIGKYIDEPKYSLEADSGSEFKNKELIKWLNGKNILLRLGAVGRSDQQGLVEYYNGVIAAVLFKKMTLNELENNETDRAWVDNLKKLIDSLNKHMKKNKTPQIERNTLQNSNEELIPIGAKVRVALNKPVNIVDGKRLIGNFRATDHRWTKDAHIIEDYSLRPNQPVMYKVKGFNNNYFTKNQIQLIKEDEKLPQKDKWIVKEIVDKITKGGRVFYKVLWDTDEITDEPRTKLIKDIPDMIEQYEESLKKKKEPVSEPKKKLVMKSKKDEIKKYTVDKILNRTKENGKVFFKVLWSTGEETTEPRTNLIKDIPDMIREYEKS